MAHTLIMKLNTHLLCRSLQRQIFIGDVVDELGRFELGSEGDIVIKICEGLALAGNVSLQAAALTFDGK